MSKSHWRSAFPEELGKFGRVIEVDYEHFHVKESAGVVKVHQNSSEFFRVGAQYEKSPNFFGSGRSLCRTQKSLPNSNAIHSPSPQGQSPSSKAPTSRRHLPTCRPSTRLIPPTDGPNRVGETCREGMRYVANASVRRNLRRVNFCTLQFLKV